MCTIEQHGNVFVLTLTGDDDHRLNPSLAASLLPTLRQLKLKATRGSVLITTSQGKFFSNGFDLALAKAAGSKASERLLEMFEAFRPVTAELFSLPMPTIAVAQGHAAAGGLVFALSHDYFLMRSDKGVLYLSEINLGLPFPDYMAAILRSKLHNVSTRRDLVLRGIKVRGEEAVKMGIVDGAYDSEESLAVAAMRLGEELGSRKWDGENYQETRKSMFPDVCRLLGLPIGKVNPKL